MLAAHSPCATCCNTSSTEPHQQLLLFQQQYPLLLQKTAWLTAAALRNQLVKAAFLLEMQSIVRPFKRHILTHTHLLHEQFCPNPMRNYPRDPPMPGQPDSPRSLLFIMALEARSRGPCWVKWYPNFRREVFFSKILAISISTLLPKG